MEIGVFVLLCGMVAEGGEVGEVEIFFCFLLLFFGGVGGILNKRIGLQHL